MKVTLEDFYYMGHYFDKFDFYLFQQDVFDPNTVDYITHEMEVELFDYLWAQDKKAD